MKGFTAFLKKEFLELSRSGRLTILAIVFVLFGIMNPAIAKLTPLMFEMMQDELKSQGLIFGEITVTARDSWAQFVKNFPMALIVAIIMLSGTFTGEYSKGTLIPMVTKGLSRSSIVISKTAVMLIIWTAGFWAFFGITYGYSAYFWDNSIMEHLGFVALCYWLLGVFLICMVTFFSAFASTSAQVMLGVGGIYLVMFIASMFAKVKKFLPTYMLETSSLMTGRGKTEDFITAIIITVVLSIAAVIASLPIVHKRQL